VQALDVAAQHRPQTDAAYEAVQVQGDTGLVAINVGVDDAGCIGALLEQGSHGAIKLGIHQDDVLAAGDRSRHDFGGVVDRPGDFQDGVDLGGSAQQAPILGDRRLAGDDRGVELVLGRHRLAIALAGFGIGAPGAFQVAVGDGYQPHAGNGRRDLQGHAPSHESGADHADTDGTAGRSPLA
jgi:hypothetical protein